jgi:hypothetical protein
MPRIGVAQPVDGGYTANHLSYHGRHALRRPGVAGSGSGRLSTMLHGS